MAIVFLITIFLILSIDLVWMDIKLFPYSYRNTSNKLISIGMVSLVVELPPHFGFIQTLDYIIIQYNLHSFF